MALNNRWIPVYLGSSLLVFVLTKSIAGRRVNCLYKQYVGWCKLQSHLVRVEERIWSKPKSWAWFPPTHRLSSTYSNICNVILAPRCTFWISQFQMEPLQGFEQPKERLKSQSSVRTVSCVLRALVCRKDFAHSSKLLFQLGWKRKQSPSGLPESTWILSALQRAASPLPVALLASLMPIGGQCLIQEKPSLVLWYFLALSDAAFHSLSLVEAFLASLGVRQSKMQRGYFATEPWGYFCSWLTWAMEK